ncbi:MAG: sugar-binding domain-containing protein [Bacteroidota bacterium]
MNQSASNEKIVLDLSGHQWQFEGISPGRGEELGFNELPPDITGDAFNWSFATVPGDVYTDLWRAGAIDDPHYGRNSLKAKWVVEREWWYKRQFDVPPEMESKRIWLIFEGVDFGCDVWFNGQRLGSHEGMFSAFKFDITDLVRFDSLRFGTNVVMVRLHPAPRRYSQVAGRKPAWHGDYWVSLPPNGIWRPVRLEAMGDISIEDTFVQSTINDDDSADLDVQIELNNPTNTAREIVVDVAVTGKNFESEKYTTQITESVPTGESLVNLSVSVPDAKLWWTWDRGEQHLYRAEVRVQDAEGNFHDQTETSFGIRELKMTHNPGFTVDQVENPWTVNINGQPLFMRSGTWGGPPDIFFGRAHPAKYRELIRLAKEANLNNLRIFGWHPPEIPLFYELCDEAGITVWQDLVPLASLSLPKDEDFKQAVFDEAIHLVKKQRNHPSLVLLEGSEELFMTAADPEYNLQFVNELGEAIRPYTSLHFLPSSPLSDEVGLKLGFKPNESYHANDLFYGEGEFTMEEYFPSLDYAVIPELAISSCPNVESIRKFIPESEVWPPGPSWGHHWTDFDVLKTLNFEVLGDVSVNSLEEFVEATQVAQGTIFQYALEYYRTRKPRTSAVCICHYITFAPDMKWGIVDYYQQTKRSYDYVKRAYQPLLVSLQYNRRRWMPGESFQGKVWIVNDFTDSFSNCTTQVQFLDQQQQVIQQQAFMIDDISPDSAMSVAKVMCDVPGDLGDVFYVKLSLSNERGEEISANEYQLLVAEDQVDRKKLKELGEEARRIKDKFGWANYFRYFQGLSGEDGSTEADEKLPTANGF